jgi:chemotaxis receptor (MCP) glutamine deamidase CheD
VTEIKSGSHEKTIYVGGIFCSSEPVVVKTLLGSCIAACLYDPVARAGGMNHFLLPKAFKHDNDSARFGAYAMDCLVGELMMKHKVDRRRLVAKVFGGAHVIGMEETEEGVPQQNVRFIRQYLADEGFALLGEDLGGYEPRLVLFNTSTGMVRVKHLCNVPSMDYLAKAEREAKLDDPKFGDVTLF